MRRSRNMPRNRVYKDDALLELASTKPRDASRIWAASRLLLREARRGEIAEGILAAVEGRAGDARTTICPSPTAAARSCRSTRRWPICCGCC